MSHWFKRALAVLLFPYSLFAGSTVVIDSETTLGDGSLFDIYEVTESGVLTVDSTGEMGGLKGDGVFHVTENGEALFSNVYTGSSTQFDGTFSGNGIFDMAYAGLTFNGTTTFSGLLVMYYANIFLTTPQSGASGSHLIGSNSNIFVRASTSIGSFRTPPGYSPLLDHINIDIDSETTLTFGGDNNSGAFNGTLRGTGHWVKVGSGTLDLSNGIISTDSNAIRNGKIQVKTSTFTNSSPTIEVSGDGQLEFVDTSDVTWSGNITHDGAIYKSNTNKLTLGRAQDFTGTFYIQAGTLSEPNNYLNNALSIDIGENATYETTKDTTVGDLSGGGTLSTPSGVTLTLRNTHDSRFTGSIDGAGALVKIGPATLTQTGTWNKSSSLSIADGTLKVLGDVSSHSQTTIQKNGTLRGNGTVGDVVTFGTLFPGQSIGTLNISGDYTQKSGSSLKIEYDGNGNSSQLKISGGATLNPNSHLELISTGTTPLLQGTTYTILTTDATLDTLVAPNTLTGTFSTVSTPYNPNLHTHFVTVDYFSKQIQFTLGPRKPIQLDASIINMSSDLSKQVTLVQMDNIDGWLDREICNRLSCNPTERFTPFVLYNNRTGEYRAHENSISDRFNLNNVTIGTQFNLFDHIGFGLAYGYTSSAFKALSNNSHLSANSNSLIAFFNYGCFYNFQFDAQLSQTFTRFNSGRAELLDATSTAKFNGYETGLQGRVGYEMDYKGVAVNPNCSLRYAYSKVDGYTETGGIEEQMSVKSDHMSQLYASIGLDFSTSYTLGSSIWRPHTGLSYLYQFLDDSRTLTTSFDNYTTARNLSIGSTGHNFALYTLGLDVGKKTTRGFIDFDTYFGTHLNFTYDLRVGISHAF